MKKTILLIQVAVLFLTITDVYSQWIPQTSGTTWNLRGVSFINANTGTVVGVSGTIRRTTNGGTNWFSQSVDSAIHLNDVDLFDVNTGMAVGWTTDSAVILYMIIQNEGWERDTEVQEPCQTRSLVYINVYTATVVGDSGTIIKTTNGGTNWFSQTSGTTNDLRGVSFTDVNTGTVVGQNGTIIKTTNGGTNWIPQTSETTNDLNGVSFFEANTGFAVGDSGTIIRTTNSGTNWIPQYSGTTNILVGVSFTDANNGTAVGTNGTIIRTTNSGTNWVLQPSGTTNDLFGVSFTNANTGTVVGAEGIILRTINGGVKVINISTIVPSKYLLEQNFPNPFNPITNIRFDIPKSNHVKIIIYNALGKELTTLVNEKLGAGSYEVDWNGSDYPSGVYFYKLTTNEFSDVKKMIMIK
ncbi:MAG: T9SS type A sorting domain-containing protein [Ignavibacteria bacterium]|nr:T9SS type A sorting domain-containing protein [Ignavibacteria bacterium]